MKRMKNVYLVEKCIAQLPLTLLGPLLKNQLKRQIWCNFEFNNYCACIVNDLTFLRGSTIQHYADGLFKMQLNTHAVQY